MYAQLYLDYNATTPCDKRVVEDMIPFLHSDFGNASSAHHPYGWIAKEAIDEATQSMASTLGISTHEIVYTSGSTESINMILKGVYRKNRNKGNHIITCKTEHKAVLDTCMFLEEEGASITYLDVLSNGMIDLAELERAITKQTILIAIMYANNETGVIQPIHDVGNLAKSYRVLFFSDATQALGKIPLHGLFETVDFACFSAHKLYGPKGVGFVYVKDTKSSLLDTFIQGGGQQRGLRGGTYNTPAIVGLARAVALCYEDMDEEMKRLETLRDTLEEGLLAIDASFVNGTSQSRLPNTLNISFDYVDGATLLRSLSRFMAVSNGSACTSASVNPSHVLTAMGVRESLALASLRFGIGRYTTEHDMDKTIDMIKKEIQVQREDNVLWERYKS